MIPKIRYGISKTFLPILVLTGLFLSGSVCARAQEEAPIGGPEELHLMVGRSLVLTSPTRVKRVSIADPTVADALIVSPNQILINGKTPGAVSFVLWDEFDQNQTFSRMQRSRTFCNAEEETGLGRNS